jgi:rod shape-determining protein MreC
MPIATNAVKRGKMQFYAKLFVYLGLACCLIFFDLKKQSFSSIKQEVSHFEYFVVDALLPSKDWVEQFALYFYSKGKLAQENETLKGDQLLKDGRLQTLASVERRVEELQALLGLYQRSAFSMHAVTVITASDSPYEQTLKVRFEDGAPVKAGDYIIGARGLVGQVLHAEGVVAAVRLISDQRASVHVQILRTGFRGVVFGRGGRGSLELKFVPEETDIEVGDVLVTSGLGGRHPYGIPVGAVVSIEGADASIFSTILLKPLANLNANEDFLALTGALGNDLFVPDN